MEHTIESISHNHDSAGSTKEIIKITVILSVLTLVELGLGYSMINMSEEGFLRHFIKGVILILMLAKAFYIIAYFMHLKHEIKNLIMTVAMPMFLFVWFIIAFLTDGDSYKNLKNRYDKHHNEQRNQKAEPKHEEEGTHKLD